jgi:hypothetical protein
MRLVVALCVLASTCYITCGSCDRPTDYFCAGRFCPFIRSPLDLVTKICSLKTSGINAQKPYAVSDFGSLQNGTYGLLAGDMIRRDQQGLSDLPRA